MEGMPMELATTAGRFVQREASLGDVRVEYIVATRRTGDWFAVGTVIHESGAPGQAAPLISGLGTTQVMAVERMLSGLKGRQHAGTAV
jgi:hypothetical protein